MDRKLLAYQLITVKQTSLCSFPCLFKVSTNCSMISCTSFKSFSYLEFIFINDVIISSRPFAALSKMGLAVSWDSGKWCRLSLYSSRFLSQTYQYIYEYNIVLPICANTCGARLVQIECCSWHGHKPSYWRYLLPPDVTEWHMHVCRIFHYHIYSNKHPTSN